MSDPAPPPATMVSYELVDDVAVVRIDDGKANAISHALADQLVAAIDRGLGEARALAILGRPGRFSAGFDLATMRSGAGEARDLLRVGAELGLKLYEATVPVVIGATGHALAMGAILLLCGDVRIGTAGDFKLGLNEVAIGMPVPRFVIELARDRLTPRQVTAAVNLSRVYDPAGAAEAGWLDEVATPESIEATTIARAAELAGYVKSGGFALTRRYLRGPVAERARDGLTQDLTTFVVEA